MRSSTAFGCGGNYQLIISAFIMAVTREKKAEVLSKLKDIFGRVSNAVFVNFHGLTVGDASEMRRSLHGEKVTYYVAKKTLLKRALEEAGLSGDIPELEGEIAVA